MRWMMVIQVTTAAEQPSHPGNICGLPCLVSSRFKNVFAREGLSRLCRCSVTSVQYEGLECTKTSCHPLYIT